MTTEMTINTDTNRYAKCIEVSRRIRWDIDADVIRGRDFDFSKKFLPDGLSKVNDIPFLTEEDKVLGANLHSGEIIASAQFERIEPDNYTPSSQGSANSCYVATDENDNLLYVFLGDSAQLFAFRAVEQ